MTEFQARWINYYSNKRNESSNIGLFRKVLTLTVPAIAVYFGQEYSFVARLVEILGYLFIFASGLLVLSGFLTVRMVSESIMEKIMLADEETADRLTCSFAQIMKVGYKKFLSFFVMSVVPTFIFLYGGFNETAMIISSCAAVDFFVMMCIRSYLKDVYLSRITPETATIPDEEAQ